MYDCLPKRLDEESDLLRALMALHGEGFDRVRMEDALIRSAPVDLDLLAECYQKLFGDEPARPPAVRLAA